VRWGTYTNCIGAMPLTKCNINIILIKMIEKSLILEEKVDTFLSVPIKGKNTRPRLKAQFGI